MRKPQWNYAFAIDEINRVLGGGALPLPVLEARVARWMEAVRSSD